MADSENRIVNAFLSYKDVLIRVLLRMSVQPSDVDDILQESLARTLHAEKRQRLEFPKSYLYTVARNIVFEESERRSREVQCEIDEAILASEASPADEELHYRQMLDVFWEALGTLPKAHQRAILLRRIYGLSHKEIARKMDVSISSVEKYFAQGIKRCQDVMSGRGYGVEQIEGTTGNRANGSAGTKRPIAGEKGRSHE
ncbi:MAG: sigma-70 family RNA polymerase sigma factor [Parvularculaceae bacterium]